MTLYGPAPGIGPFRAFLVALGWELTGETRDGATQWVSDRGHLLLPSPDDPEREWMLDRAVERLAVALGLSASTLAPDIAVGGVDQLRVTVRPENDAYPGTLPFLLTVTLLEVLRDLVLTAADAVATYEVESAGERRRWRDAFTERVRFGQTQMGSFVVAALLPTTIDAPLHVAGEPVAERYARAVSRELYRLLAEAQRAAGRATVFSTPSDDRAIRAITRLLAKLPDGTVTFDVLWSEAGPPAEHQEPVSLRASDLGSLERVTDLAEVHSARPAGDMALSPGPIASVKETFELTGTVVAVRRLDATVQGLVNGKTRRVRVDVDDKARFQQAIDAFSRDVRVRAIGRLVLRPNSARLESVFRFELLDEAEV